jgi:hypothetical protein
MLSGRKLVELVEIPLRGSVGKALLSLFLATAMLASSCAPKKARDILKIDEVRGGEPDSLERRTIIISRDDIRSVDILPSLKEEDSGGVTH